MLVSRYQYDYVSHCSFWVGFFFSDLLLLYCVAPKGLANEKRNYTVTSFCIGWAHAQNDHWFHNLSALAASTTTYWSTSIWTNGWASNQEASNLIRHRAHYNVTVIKAGEGLRLGLCCSVAMTRPYTICYAWYSDFESSIITHIITNTKTTLLACWNIVGNSEHSCRPTLKQHFH